MGSRIRTAMLFAKGESDRRRHPRGQTLHHLILRMDGRKRVVSFEDISLGGIGAFSPDTLRSGAPVILAFPKPHSKAMPALSLIEVFGRIVRHAHTGVLGIAFDPGQERTVRTVMKTLPFLQLHPPKAKANTTSTGSRTAKPRPKTKPTPTARRAGRKAKRR
jgi:hypothetical protein